MCEQTTTFSETANRLMKKILADNTDKMLHKGVDYGYLVEKEKTDRKRYIPQSSNRYYHVTVQSVLNALNECQTQDEAAKMLGISKSCLVNRISEFGIIKKEKTDI